METGNFRLVQSNGERGWQGVDLEAAREKGISVANVLATVLMPNPSQSMEYC